MNEDAKEFVAALRSGWTLVLHPDDLKHLMAHDSFSLKALLLELMLTKHLVESEHAAPGQLIAYRAGEFDAEWSVPPTAWH